MTVAGAGVFVKTIGLSPLKTRLAASIGQDKAHEFYRYSCRAIFESLRRAEGYTPYWAVAEGAKAFSQWPGDTLEQGSGELGHRLFHVYQQLLDSHDYGVLLGGDAPQLEPSLLETALSLGNDGSFVMGPSLDGGFYLLLGSRPIPLSVWQAVPYSHPETGSTLVNCLESLGPVKLLEAHGDVDEFNDIPAVLQDLEQITNGNQAQNALVSWLRTVSKQ